MAISGEMVDDHARLQNRSSTVDDEKISSDYYNRFSTRVDRQRGHFRQLFWTHKHATVTYCLVFWAFGMCVAFLGPTLWDLGCQTGTTIGNMTWVFLAQSLFILIGSMMGGLLLQRYSSHIIMLIGTISITLTLSIIPACKSVGTLAFVLGIMGFNMGLLDTTTNVSMLQIYGLDVSPFLQALHFFYGLGAFLSPMISEPFLKNFDCTKLIIGNESIATGWFEQKFLENQWTEEVLNPPKTLSEAQENMQINHAFWIMSFLQVPVVLLTLSLVFKNRINSALHEKKSQPSGVYENIESPVVDSQAYKTCCTLANRKTITVVSLACALLFLADGMQGAFGGLIFTYGHVNEKHMTMQDSATVNAVFWGFFAFGRLLAIVAALYFAPGFMLFCDILGSLGAMILLLIFRHSVGILYLGTAIFGLFLSNIYPTTISLTEQFVEIGPSATSCIVVGAATGEMLYPVLVGNLLYKFGPNAFLAVGNITLLLMVCVFLALWVAGLYSRDQKTTEALFARWLPSVLKRKKSTEGIGLAEKDTEVTYYKRLKEDSTQSLNNLDQKFDSNTETTYQLQQQQKPNGWVERTF